MTPTLHLHVLASGSKGNAAIVRGPQGCVLIDCGIGPRVMAARAAACGCDLADVVAVLVTHEHSDHVSGLSVFAGRHQVPLYATAGTVAARDYLSDLAFSVIDAHAELALAGMLVTAFPTSHDVADPVGFRFAVVDANGCVIDSIGWCTDTGVLTDAAAAALAGCRIIGIEANHDVDLLRTGAYPAYLKARVGGVGGHLSNAQCAAALPDLVGASTQTVVALHLSEKNNDPRVCVRALAAAVGATEVDAVEGGSSVVRARTPDGSLTVDTAAQREALTVW